MSINSSEKLTKLYKNISDVQLLSSISKNSDFWNQKRQNSYINFKEKRAESIKNMNKTMIKRKKSIRKTFLEFFGRTNTFSSPKSNFRRYSTIQSPILQNSPKICSQKLTFGLESKKEISEFKENKNLDESLIFNSIEPVRKKSIFIYPVESTIINEENLQIKKNKNINYKIKRISGKIKECSKKLENLDEEINHVNTLAQNLLGMAIFHKKRKISFDIRTTTSGNQMNSEAKLI